MEFNNSTKQVIVFGSYLRNTLGHKIRTGKIVAQCCHASMSFLTKGGQIRVYPDQENPEKNVGLFQVVLPNNYEQIQSWLTKSFTKATVKATSEAELLSIYEQAKEAGLLVHLIQDSGKTEFGGVPTYTCLAIGPNLSSEIDPITGHLETL